MNGIADRYLKSCYVVQRLLSEYEKYGRLIVAVDFDNTIFDYHKRGDSFPKVIDLMKEAKELGCKIIIYSCRQKDKHEEIKNYLEENNIPYDTINEPIVRLSETDGYGSKIFYSILLDDRSGLSSAYWDLDTTFRIIKTKTQIKGEEYYEKN